MCKMVDYKATLAFLHQHGNVNHASITPEGIVATCWERASRLRGYNDAWYEVTAVFPVTDDGKVDSGPVRAWLGY